MSVYVCVFLCVCSHLLGHNYMDMDMFNEQENCNIYYLHRNQPDIFSGILIDIKERNVNSCRC